MQLNVDKLLLDVVSACEDMLAFHEGITFDAFLQDKMLQLATERQFEIIGEAIARLSRIDDVRLQKNIPEYRNIIGFRNVIAHGYDVIDQAVLWDFAAHKVPDLLVRVKSYN
ncbi:MAG TPA: hypothetical protein DCE78_03105 [Bacteroidetes bacterium]|nr:hypothetical protein [Bacteroidota bacterium]